MNIDSSPNVLIKFENPPDSRNRMLLILNTPARRFKARASFKSWRPRQNTSSKAQRGGRRVGVVFQGIYNL